MSHTFSIASLRDDAGEVRRTVTVLFEDGRPYTADNEHPNFAEICSLVMNPPTESTYVPPKWDYSDDPVRPQYIPGHYEDTEAQVDQRLLDLFDVGIALGTKFEKLSDRVSYASGHIYFDGDEVQSVLSDQVLRFHKEGHDFGPLVKFWEKIATNPNEHSREQLYGWLTAQGDFQITDDGDLIAYKGVRSDGKSISSGPAIVDGVAVNGNVPNDVGSVIQMSRSQVHHDPSQGCSVGLHAGTYSYASGFAQGLLLKVLINPRDVVSVPTDCSWSKMRVCEYKVLEHITAPDTSSLYGYDANEWGEFDDEDWEEIEAQLDEVEDEEGDDAPVDVPAGALRSILGALRRKVQG